MISEISSTWIYLTEGGESKVYLHPDGLSVIKLNDAAYYATWLEYVLKQTFVASEETADLNANRELLEFNGFEHKVRQD